MVVDKKSLIEKGLIEESRYNLKIKILNRGKLDKKIKLEVNASKSVIEAVKKV